VRRRWRDPRCPVAAVAVPPLAAGSGAVRRSAQRLRLRAWFTGRSENVMRCLGRSLHWSICAAREGLRTLPQLIRAGFREAASKPTGPTGQTASVLTCIRSDQVDALCRIGDSIRTINSSHAHLAVSVQSAEGCVHFWPHRASCIPQLPGRPRAPEQAISADTAQDVPQRAVQSPCRRGVLHDQMGNNHTGR